MRFIILYFLALFFLASCKPEKTQASYLSTRIIKDEKPGSIVPGADRLALYFPLIKQKKIALVVNQTSIVKGVHIVDSLHKIGVNIAKIFVPEHGFRGSNDAGEHVPDEIDPNTNIPIVSLYGSKKKPLPADFDGVDVVVFDLQDVGVRFYTYISTLHYMMEACAENNIKLIVLDRPNPNAHYIDGPVLKAELKSFVGIHPVPVVYGMTIGEYAQMINGEGWLNRGLKCELTVIPINNYTHDTYYELPVKPSPNLPNARSILLYPSLCFFEGTNISVGRGTDHPFEIIGHPDLDLEYTFTPQPNFGSKSPPHMGKICHGLDLTRLTIDELRKQKLFNLEYVIRMYQHCQEKNIPFFLENLFFDKLAGTESLRKMLKQNYTEETIRKSWQADLEAFKQIRKKYLLYE